MKIQIKGFRPGKGLAAEFKAAKVRRRDLTKAVTIEVLSQDNKKVIQRWRFVPPNKRLFTDKGVDQTLDNFIDTFERDNPDHRYRLVVMTDRYRLVWEPEEKPDTQAEALKELVSTAKAMPAEALKEAICGQ